MSLTQAHLSMLLVRIWCIESGTFETFDMAWYQGEGLAFVILSSAFLAQPVRVLLLFTSHVVLIVWWLWLSKCFGIVGGGVFLI